MYFLVLITTAIRTTMATAVSRQLQYLWVWLQLQRYGLPRRLRLMRGAGDAPTFQKHVRPFVDSGGCLVPAEDRAATMNAVE